MNVNTFDEDRTSPLHVAARHASIQVVEELINWGALVDITDSDGWSPIHVASFFQRPVVCHLLLKKGANPLIPNKDNARPADLARDPKLKEIFETFFSKSTGGASSNRSRDKQKFTNRNNIINHTLTETEQDLRIENSNNDNKPKRLILACNAVDLNSKQNSWDFLGNNEEPARLPNLIFPKQHKYYLYFKNLKVKSSVFNEKNPNQLVVNTINSLSFSDNDEEDLQANYLENQSELSSVIFCDDSQIEDNEDKGKNLALNFQINKSSKINKINRRTSKLNADYRQIKQNIPFKLKNIYTSFLNVKKGLKFQSKNSGVNQENNKAQLPLRSNFKPPSVDFASCKNVAHYTKNPLTLNKNIQRSYTPDSSRSFLFVENKVIKIKDIMSSIKNI